MAACASNPADDQFTAEEIAPAEVKPAQALVPSAEFKSIDAELASIDAQIQAAQARLSQYQIQNNTNSVTQSQITGAEAEISHYQGLKTKLMARKQGLIQSTIK